MEPSPDFPPPLDERRLREACAQLMRRIGEGEAVRAEKVLEQHPEIAGDEDAVVEVIYSELVAREELKQRIVPEEWYARFPALRDRLRKLFEFHALIRDQPGPAPDSESLSGLDSDFVPGRLGPLPPAPIELIEEIGRGGMGVVYKARQVSLGRVVALKMILAGSHAEPSQRRRFVTEAEVIARLQHPNILQIHDVGERDGLPCLILEYVEGMNLAEWQRENRPDPAWAAGLVETLALAIHHAHRKGIVHRDLKPANVLISRDGSPKISDFGLAKVITENTTSSISRGTILGTPGYMAPELVEGGSERIGPAIDVYALGAILHELLAGGPRFSGTSPLEAMRRMLDEPPKAPSSLRAGVPRDLDTICLKCLERSPEKRYASAADLAEDLRRFLDGEPILARPIPRWEQALKWARRRPSEALLVGFSVLVVLGVMGETAWSNAWLRRHGQALQAALERAERNERNEHLARLQHYDLQIRLAQNAWDSKHVELAQELLEDQPPEKAGVDLRGFEWYYLHRVCHREMEILTGHFAPVSVLAMSPVAPIIATGDTQGQILLQNFVTGQERPVRGQHGLRVAQLAFSPDGSVLASAGYDWNRPGFVKLWDVASGKELVTLPAVGLYETLQFSDSGRTLFAMESPGYQEPSALRFWDLSKGFGRPSLASSLEGIRKVACSGDLRTLAAYDGEGRITIREVATGNELKALYHKYENVQGFALSHDGTRLALGFEDRRVIVWDLKADREGQVFADHEGAVGELVFSPDGKYLASGEDRRFLAIRDLASRRKWSARTEKDGILYHLVFSPDGRSILSGEEWCCRRWDVATGKPISRMEGLVKTPAFSRDGQTVFTLGTYPRVRAWQLSPPAFLDSLDGHEREIWALAFSADGKTLLSASDDNSIAVWDLATGMRLGQLWGHKATVSSLAFSPDGRSFVSSDLGHEIRLWDVSRGEEWATYRATFVGHGDRIRSVVFSPDGKTLASAGKDQTVRLWDVASKKCLATLTEHTDTMKGVAFSPDGKLLASAGADGNILIRSPVDGRVLRSWQASDKVTSIAFSPDSKWLATGSEDGTATIWNPADKHSVAILRGHHDFVLALAFSPDGQSLATGSKDGTVRLWDPLTGHERLTLRGHDSQVNAVAFSPDGRLLVSGGHDGSIRLWEAPRDDPH
ncbi:protein kinase domain-containing protein [Singulisphaera sp. PoT]|uniref:protein kinase domain-containing protein n=1 Tax=Singulisphaera sp. PoT TaxID=3411797 RepID=UPI003BF5008E